MTRFLARSLALLDRLYRFEGGQVRTNKLDLSSIQLVHDVSREVERATTLFPGTGGFANIAKALTHAAADNQETTIDPYANPTGTLAFWPVADSSDLAWLMAVSAQHAAAVDPSVVVSIGWPDGASASASGASDYPVFFNSGAGSDFNESTGLPAEIGIQTSRVITRLPLPVIPGALVRISSTSVAAGACRVNCLFWYGKAGSTPPGSI